MAHPDVPQLMADLRLESNWQQEKHWVLLKTTTTDLLHPDTSTTDLSGNLSPFPWSVLFRVTKRSQNRNYGLENEPDGKVG